MNKINRREFIVLTSGALLGTALRSRATEPKITPLLAPMRSPSEKQFPSIISFADTQ